MKRFLKKTLVLLLAASLLPDVASLAASEPAATPSQTMIPVKVSGTVAGTVIHVEENDIVVNMDNGNTVLFMLNYLHITDAAVGDKVSVEYSGDVLDAPEAVTITVTEKAQQDLTISGTVMAYDDSRVFVAISSGNVFGFTLDKETVISGKAKKLTEGDAVTVTYLGQLDAIPYAKGIEVTTVAKAVKKTAEEKLQNKTLDGYVRALSDSKLTVHTNSGKNYSFTISGDTKVIDSYSLEKGAKVRVTYDGYASKTPPAKVIKVQAPPDPTPPSPKYLTTSGTVESMLGIFLSLTNGATFDCSGASFGGNSDGQEGDKAKVTYYVDDDGVYHATKVTFTAIDLEEEILPMPEPDPDPDELLGSAE